MAKKHSSEAFYALDDPLEAAVFSILVEMLKEADKPTAKMVRMRSRLLPFHNPDLIFRRPEKLRRPS